MTLFVLGNVLLVKLSNVKEDFVKFYDSYIRHRHVIGCY